MKRFITVLCTIVVISSCKHQKNIPDVSQIQVDLTTIRYERDFFSIDTTHIDSSLQLLFSKRKGFSEDFLFNILGIPLQKDTVAKNVKQFIATYHNIYAASIKPFADFTPTESKVKEALKYVHFYFPKYPLPTKIITFIGPLNSYAGIITPDNSLAVGLQLYMGKDYTVYHTDEVLDMYPTYISRKFEPDYISVNCMKNIVDDLFTSIEPPKKGGQLIEQMIEQGKKLYVLDAFLPSAPDSLKTGYTQQQIEGCNASEKNIWIYFVQNDLIYQTDPTLISPYLNDAPNTAELGQWSPGNIGQFVGGQIVKKWMEKNNTVSLEQLIKTPAKQIFEEAKYRPN